MTDVVEVHIRGVGGATAGEILGGPVKQLSGDEVAGFYQLRDGSADVEAYEWGRLTSGTASRAIWWLLLPFTLYNVSGWMFRPKEGEVDRTLGARDSLWWGRLLVVVGSLLTTAIYVAWIAVLTVELLALDCGAGDCRSRWYLAPLRWNEGDIASRFLVGLGLAWIVVFLLLWFSKRTHPTTERFRLGPAEPGNGAAEFRLLGTNDDLENESLWMRGHVHRATFSRHLSAALFTLFGIAAYGFVFLDDMTFRTGTIVLGAFVAAAVLFGIVVLDRSRLPWNLSAAAVGVLVGIAMNWFLDRPAAARLDLTDIGLRLFLILPMMVGIFLIVAVAIRERSAIWSLQGFRFIGAATAAILSVYVVSAGFSSLAHVIGRFLLGGDMLEELHYNESVVDLFGIGLVTVAVTIGVATKLHGGRASLAGVAEDYDVDLGAADDRTRKWLRKAESRRWLSQRVRDVDLVLSLLALGIFVVQLIQVIQTAIDRSKGSGSILDVDTWSTERFLSPLFGWDGISWIHTGAAWVIVLFLFPGLQLMRLMFSSRANRRQISKVWDVMSFWPRRFHPLAAPCYAERAVPEFAKRIEQHRAEGKRVSIVSHSQGTVIVVAALSLLRADDRRQARTETARRLEGVAVTTYGSPLKSLYRSFFPRYFDGAGSYPELRPLLHQIDDEPGWRNLWRPTDYIGQSIFDGPSGVPCGQGGECRIREADQVLFPINSHSDYEHEPELVGWLQSVRTELARQP